MLTKCFSIRCQKFQFCLLRENSNEQGLWTREGSVFTWMIISFFFVTFLSREISQIMVKYLFRISSEMILHWESDLLHGQFCWALTKSKSKRWGICRPKHFPRNVNNIRRGLEALRFRGNQQWVCLFNTGDTFDRYQRPKQPPANTWS